LTAKSNDTSKQFNRGDSVVAGIFLEDEIIGVVSIKDIGWTESEFCIGYWIAESYQGKGIVTRFVSKLIKLGFDILNLQKALIYVSVENSKSISIPLRLGFNKIDVIKDRELLYGKYMDHIKFMLNKADI
jgi:ribosomal-protein-serine acetyltransferase